MAKHQFKLGSKAKDKVTGFTGTLTIRHESLHGTTQYYITAPAKDNGAPVGEYFNHDRIQLIKSTKVKP